MASVVRLDKVKAVYNGHIQSMVHSAEVQNGNIVTTGTLKAGERELFNVTVPTAGIGNVWLVANPEIRYEQFKSTDADLKLYTNEAGKGLRAYKLESGDIFSVSVDGVSLIGANPVVGNAVIAQAGLTLKEVATTTTEAFVGRIIATDTIGTVNVGAGINGASVSNTTTFVVIRVEKN